MYRMMEYYQTLNLFCVIIGKNLGLGISHTGLTSNHSAQLFLTHRLYYSQTGLSLPLPPPPPPPRAPCYHHSGASVTPTMTLI